MKAMTYAAGVLLAAMMCATSDAAPTHLVTFRGVVQGAYAPFDGDVHVGESFVATIALDANALFPTPAAPWTFATGTYTFSSAMDAYVQIYDDQPVGAGLTEDRFSIFTPGFPAEPCLVVDGGSAANPFASASPAELFDNPLWTNADFGSFFHLFIEVSMSTVRLQSVFAAISTMEITPIPEPALAMSCALLVPTLAMRRFRRA